MSVRYWAVKSAHLATCAVIAAGCAQLGDPGSPGITTDTPTAPAPPRTTPKRPNPPNSPNSPNPTTRPGSATTAATWPTLSTTARGTTVAQATRTGSLRLVQPIAGAEPAEPASCAPTQPTADALARAFAEPGLGQTELQEGFGGGDYPHAYPLPDGRVLWLFQDLQFSNDNELAATNNAANPMSVEFVNGGDFHLWRADASLYRPTFYELTIG
jgi:hypothetical protein